MHTRRSVALGFLLAASLIAECGPVATPTTEPPSTQSITTDATQFPEHPTLQVIPDAVEPLPPLVFVRAGNLFRSDGSAQAPVQLTDFDRYSVSASSPSVSSDGQSVAFIKSTAAPVDAAIPLARAALVVMRVDGTGMRTVWEPPQAFVWRPTWSADGGSIYVAADVWADPSNPQSEHAVELMRVDVATGATQAIAPNVVSATASRDGAWLVFVQRDEDYKTQLVRTTPDGQTAATLINTSMFEEIYAPRFAPNSSQIVFAAIGGPAVDPRGVPIARVVPWPLLWIGELFAPDPASAHGEAYDLWSINVDGTNLKRLTFMLADTPVAAFSPDSTEIIINSGTGVYRMASDGKNLRRIDQGEEHQGGGVDWLP